MRTRLKPRRAEHPSALFTNSSVGGSCSSDNTDPLQRNGDVLANRDVLVVVYLITQEAHKWLSGKNESHIGSTSGIQGITVNFVNSSYSFINPSTNKNYEIIVPCHISIINCATSKLHLLNYFQKMFHSVY